MLNENTGKLGFGLMRLPRRGPVIDIAHTSDMVDAFLEAGFTYFDTAHVYPGSETAAKKALVSRHPRESFTLATKLFAASAPTAEIAKSQLRTSLRKTGAGYIDYYLLHTLMSANYKIYEKYGLWDFVKEKKAEGVLKHIGFSFHSGPTLLEKILTAHPEAEFVQLQINYADWESKSVAARENYEVARKFGKPVIIMEPVKGGSLAKPPKAVQKFFSEYAPERSFASWAIRFAASLEGVHTVLSGMSNREQMADNLSYMKDFTPLNEEERAILQEAMRQMGKLKTIPCTACGYCTKGCPQSIPIPQVFAAMNKRLGSGLLSDAKADYHALQKKGTAADGCIACGQCEDACPQHLSIIRLLKETHEALAS